MAEPTNNWLQQRLSRLFKIFTNISSWWKGIKLPKFSLHSIEETLGKWVSILLRIGTVILLVILIAFVISLFRDRGYVIEAFSVPKALTESGYSGGVVARHLQDEVNLLKNSVNSAKTDSIVLIGNEEPELDLAVMGIGLSLNSVTYHLRRMFGGTTKVIRGEIVQLDDIYQLTLRMTGYSVQTREVKIVDGNHKKAIHQLLERAGEAILENMDPYRLAVHCYHQERWEEAMRMVRKTLRTRPQESHWAYLAWAGVLVEKNLPEAAIAKLEKAMEIKPDFELPLVRLTWLYHELDRIPESHHAAHRLVTVAADNSERWRNIGWMFHQQGDYAMTDSFFLEALALNPDDPNIHINMGDSKFQRGDFEGAIPHIQKAEELAGENEDGLTIRAFLSFATGDTTSAIQYAYEAWDLNPNNQYTTNICLQAAGMSEDFEKFRQVYDHGAWRRFNDGTKQNFLNRTAMIYNDINLRDSAFSCIQQAIAIDESVGYPYSTLAEIYAMEGDIEQFYYNLEIAFQKGMKVMNIENSTTKPYPDLKNDPRFQALLNKYRAPKLKG